MAVQAHYHHHHHREFPFLVSGGGGTAESSRLAAAMELRQAQKEAMAPQHALPDFSHGGCGGGRKRQREAEPMSPQLFSLQQQQQPQAQGPKFINLAQLHKRPATGLRLDLDEGSVHVSCTSSASASCLLLSEELAAQRDQHRNEMERLVQEHTERLRRALADTRRRHYRSLVGAAEAAAARRMREKESEAWEAARLSAEAAAWQAKALADQSTAAALHAQLQQAQARDKAAEEEDDAGAAADDAGSCFVDPDRVVEIAPPPARPCRACRRRSASVVLLPCRHLCICAECEPAVPAAPFAAGAVAVACPVCRGAVTGTVQVLASPESLHQGAPPALGSRASADDLAPPGIERNA